MMKSMGKAVAVALLAALAAKAEVRAAESYASRGYRLREYRWDAVLGQRWAVFDDAAHPERPLVSELDPGGNSGAVSQVALAAAALPPVVKLSDLVVHSGEAVTLWRDEGNVRMQLAAVSEGNAAVGQQVQLRVTGAGVFGSTGWRATGVVRGPGSVEMQ